MKAPLLDANRALRLLDPPGARRRVLLFWAAIALVALLFGISAAAGADGFSQPSTLLGWPLEMSFTLSALLAGVLCFRAWERLFPTEVPSLYALYPLRGASVVARELRLGFFDALGMFVVLAVWLIPVAFGLRGGTVGYILAYDFIAALLTALLAFAIPSSYVRHLRKASSTPGDAQRTMRRALSAAPALSFGVTITLLLLLKLGMEELARAELAPWALLFERADEAGNAAPVPRSALVALGIPLLAGALVFAEGLWRRTRSWLKDIIVVSAAAVELPELSYAWIDARPLGDSRRSKAALLSHRDRERVHRSAPFRLWGAGGITLVALFFVALGTNTAAMVALGVNTLWILGWLRVPQRVVEVMTPGVTQWDRLLVDDETIRDARRLTMLRTLFPYFALVSLPGALYFGRQSVWAAVAFVLVCALLLAVHAVVSLKGIDD